MELWRNSPRAHLASNSLCTRMCAFPHSIWVSQSAGSMHLEGGLQTHALSRASLRGSRGSIAIQSTAEVCIAWSAMLPSQLALPGRIFRWSAARAVSPTISRGHLLGGFGFLAGRVPTEAVEPLDRPLQADAQRQSATRRPARHQDLANPPQRPLAGNRPVPAKSPRSAGDDVEHPPGLGTTADRDFSRFPALTTRNPLI
jgi:hypothetical protein